MATWWIDFDSGSDGGPTSPGTQVAPRKTFPLNANISSGDTFYLKGEAFPLSWAATIEGIVIHIEGKDNITIDKWPDEEEGATLYGGKATDEVWTATGFGNEWECILAADLTGLVPEYTTDAAYTPVGLSINYRTSNVEGYKAGFLPRRTLAEWSAGGQTAAAYEGYYVDTTPVGGTGIYINQGAGFDPNNEEILICLTHQKHICYFNNCDNLTVRNVKLRHATSNDGSYGLQILGCDSPTIENIDGEDLGTHLVVFYSCTGTKTAINVGGKGGNSTSTGTCITCFADGGADADNMTVVGGALTSLWQPRRLFKYGASAATIANYSGGATSQYVGQYIYCHTSGGGNVRNIYFRDASFTYDADFLVHNRAMGAIIDIDNLEDEPVAAEDELDPEAYPVRVERVTWNNVPTWRVGSNLNSLWISYKDCVFVGQANKHDWNEGWIRRPHNVPGKKQYDLFVNCILACDTTTLDASNGNWHSFVTMPYNHANYRHQFLNCTFVSLRNTAFLNAQQFFVLGYNLANILLKRCIFAFRRADTNAGLFRGVTDVGDGTTLQAVIQNNRYYNIQAARYISQDGDFDQSTEFLNSETGIDRSGATLSTVPFTAIASGDYSIAATSPLRTTDKATNTDGEPARGINGRLYDGTFGAYQYGTAKGYYPGLYYP